MIPHRRHQLAEGVAIANGLKRAKEFFRDREKKKKQYL
jgi:hypothetical protein